MTMRLVHGCPVIAAALALALAPLAPAQSAVWVVDDDGPAAFEDIQPAVDAARPGDTILVRDGRYSGFTTAKALVIVGEGSVRVNGRVIIEDLDPVDVMVLRGIAISSGSGLDGLVVRDADGVVWLEDVQARGGFNGASGLRVARSRHVSAANCLIAASTLGQVSGAHLSNSRVSFYSTDCYGADGSEFYPAGDGCAVFGSTSQPAFFYAAGVRFFGGCCSLQPGNGLFAFSGSANGYQVEHVDSRFVPGPGGEPIVARGPGTVTETPLDVTRYSVSSPVRAGNDAVISYTGVPGTQGLTMLSFAPTSSAPFLPLFAGVLQLGPVLAVIPHGAIPPSRTLAADLRLPGLPAGIRAVTLYAQCVTLSPRGTPWLGAPSALTILDPAL